jgi:hypothetical protein
VLRRLITHLKYKKKVLSGKFTVEKKVIFVLLVGEEMEATEFRFDSKKLRLKVLGKPRSFSLRDWEVEVGRRNVIRV